MELLDGTAVPYATVRIMTLVIMLTEVVQTIFALQDGKKQTAIQVQYNIHIHVFIPPAYEVCHGGLMFLSFLSVCVWCVCVCVCKQFSCPLHNFKTA